MDVEGVDRALEVEFEVEVEVGVEVDGEGEGICRRGVMLR